MARSEESATGEPVYLHGSINQQTFSLTLRATYNLTPDFTIQYYGQPFIARGVYEEFRYVTDDPLATKLDARLARFNPRDITRDEDTGRFNVDEASPTGALDFRNPDFNILQFRSNAVVRWEYLPSSTLFFVWSQSVTGGADPSTGVFDALANDLFGEGIENTFLVKATYRWVP